ncbi:MAG: MerR family transcriptional regulator [Candidatus Binataceae bacterium]
MAFPAAGEAAQTFKIGEAARIVGVEAYVLRFWETQFPVLRPSHTQSKHRVYRQKDIELLKQIKQLLHAERFTIEGAKKRLKELNPDDSRPQSIRAPEAKADAKAEANPPKRDDLRQALAEIRDDLESLHKLLDD